MIPPRIVYVYNYNYIQLPSTHGSHGGGHSRFRLTADAQALSQVTIDRLDAMMTSEVSPAKKLKLAKLRGLIAGILGVIASIPSAGMRQKLTSMVKEIMALAERNPDGAIEMASAMLSLALACDEVCRHILGDIAMLRQALGVAGPAKGLLQAIAGELMKAMNGASSLSGLEAISGLADRAVHLMKEIAGLKPGSAEYARLMEELLQVSDAIDAQLNSETPQTGDSTSGLAVSSRQQMNGAMDTLRKRTTDALVLQQIDDLQNTLLLLLQQANHSTDPEWAREQVKQILAMALGGDLQGAATAAAELALLIAQLGKLAKVVETKAGRLQALLPTASPALKKVLQGLLDAIDQAKQQAHSPAEMLALDAQLMQAIEAANSLAGSANPTREKAFLELRKLEKALVSKCSPGAGAATAPLGYDGYDSSSPGAGKPARPPGTRPLLSGKGTGLLASPDPFSPNFLESLVVPALPSESPGENLPAAKNGAPKAPKNPAKPPTPLHAVAEKPLVVSLPAQAPEGGASPR